MNTIDDLRTHLFATLDGLRSKTDPMDIDRAKAVAEVAGKVIESAKVECEHMKLTGSQGSGFIPKIDAPQIPGQPRLVKGVAQSGSK